MAHGIEQSDDARKPVAQKGRKSDEKRAIIRQQIIDAAYVLFINEGHTAVGLRQVSGKLAITLGRVQHYFKHKNDLISEVITKSLVEHSRAIEELARIEGIGAKERFDRIFTLLYRAAIDPEAVKLRFHIRSLSLTDHAVSMKLEESHTYTRDILGNILKAIKPGLSRMESRVLAITLISLIEGASLFCRPGTRSEIDARLIQRAYKRAWDRAVLPDNELKGA